MIEREAPSLLAALDSPGSSSLAALTTTAMTPSSFQSARKVSSLVRVKPEPSEAAFSQPGAQLYPVLPAPNFSSLAPETSELASDSLYPQLPPIFSPSPMVSNPFAPTSACLSQKRLSDFGSDSETDSSELKRSKFEPPSFSKTPLAAVNRNTGFTHWQTVLDHPHPPPTPSSVEEIRAKIESVQLLISKQQSAYNHYAAKKQISKGDMTRLKKCHEELKRLRMLKEEYNASIPSTSKRTLSKAPSFFGAGTAKPDTNTNALWSPPAHSVLHNPMAARVPVVEQPQPQLVASSSKLAALASESSDDEDGEMPGQGIYGLPDVLTNRIGPIVPVIAPMGNADNFDDNGDFYGRGRDTFMGPQAKADEYVVFRFPFSRCCPERTSFFSSIDKFLVEAGNAESFDDNATVEQALEKLGLQTQYDLLPGMEVALMPHQTIGVAWMLEKEKSNYKGGSLGDDMGLGKVGIPPFASRLGLMYLGPFSDCPNVSLLISTDFGIRN